MTMRPIGWGLAAVLVAAVLAPVAVISAPKGLAPVSDAQRKQGMAEAPAVVQAAGLACQVSDARFIGKSADPKAKTETSYYEVACGQSMGYVLQAPKGGQPSVFSCVELIPQPGQAVKEGALSCVLPGNSDPKAHLAPMLTKAGVQCVPEKARGIGQTKTNTFVEVACQGGAGYIVVASAPLDPSKEVQAQNCLNFDDQPGALKCTLTEPAARLAVVDSFAAAANNGCTVKDRRFVGSSKDGADFFEASCQNGKGYIFKVANGKLAQTWDCGQAQGILGGCTLTDARQATADQAALYTRLARQAGSDCDVERYAAFPMSGNQEVVELACKSGAGAIGFFPATGPGQVLDCGRALAKGYKCSLTKDGGFASLTQDLKKFGKSTCTVSNARVGGKTPKGTVMVEVACADGLKGYMIEYNTAPTVTAVGAQGCAFSGGCQLPGNV
jgi:hypothetical protein